MDQIAHCSRPPPPPWFWRKQEFQSHLAQGTRAANSTCHRIVGATQAFALSAFCSDIPALADLYLTHFRQLPCLHGSESRARQRSVRKGGWLSPERQISHPKGGKPGWSLLCHKMTRFWNDPVGTITPDSARKPTVAGVPVEAIGHAPFGVLLRKDLHSLKP